MQPKDRIILALRMRIPAVALEFLGRALPYIGMVRVGLPLLISGGQKFVSGLIEEFRVPVFLDLKLHDIPSEAADAAAEAARLGARMISVHAWGGKEMMRAAKAAVNEEVEKRSLRPCVVVAATVLTSRGEGPSCPTVVLSLADDAREAGLDGVVCAVQETTAVRRLFGKDFIIVNTAISTDGCRYADQQRTGSPQQAIAAGADYLVIGRAITQAPNPINVAEEIMREIAVAAAEGEVKRNGVSPRAEGGRDRQTLRGGRRDLALRL